MAFTYIGDLSTDLDQTRFHIGDTVADQGPLPDMGNFEDSELTSLVTLAGSVDNAVAVAFDAIASRWSARANGTIGPRREELGEVAQSFRDQAKQWRDDRGIHTRSTAGSSWLTRDDAYSQGVSAGDV